MSFEQPTKTLGTTATGEVLQLTGMLTALPGGRTWDEVPS